MPIAITPRRRLAAALGLLAWVRALAADTGIVMAPIHVQERQKLPGHKQRMLNEHFGNQAVLVHRDLEPAAGAVPLHAGYGTHYSYFYVGTPPQRVSVIVDTGSHWTAFPCDGCK